MIGELNETRASIISLFLNEKEIKKSTNLFNDFQYPQQYQSRRSFNFNLIQTRDCNSSDMFTNKLVKLWKPARHDDFVISWVPIFRPCFGISLAFWYLFLLMKDEEHS